MASSPSDGERVHLSGPSLIPRTGERLPGVAKQRALAGVECFLAHP
jgi:hypothetical protein